MPMYPPRPTAVTMHDELYDPKDVVRLLINGELFVVEPGTYREKEISFDTKMRTEDGQRTNTTVGTTLEMFSFKEMHTGLRWIGQTNTINAMGLDETT